MTLLLRKLSLLVLLISMCPVTSLARCYSTDLPELKIEEGDPPAVIGSYLEGKASNWYRHSIELSGVDSFFQGLREVIGQERIYLGGGSDLVQIILGLRKRTFNGYAEVNLLYPKGTPIIDTFKIFDEKQIGEKLEVENLNTNGESGGDLEGYVENFNSGKPLVTDQPTIMVPVKSMGVAEVSPDGIRLYFRTREELEAYQNKEIRLPLEGGQLLADAWLGEGNASSFVDNTVSYSLVLAARSYESGWRIDQATVEFLEKIVTKLNPIERKTVFDITLEKVEEKSARDHLRTIAESIGLI